MENMDAKLAYKAMVRFLENYWKVGQEEEIAVLLSSMSLEIFQDGKPADPAMWSDWLQAIADVMAEQGQNTNQ
jgi:hypothetical protein